MSEFEITFDNLQNTIELELVQESTTIELSITDAAAFAVSALPNKVDKVEGMGLSSNDFTNEEKAKLATVTDGANPNVQADWNVTDTTSDAYIKNKPSWTIDSALSTTSENPVQNKVITNALNTKLEGVSVNGVAQTVTNHVAEISAVTEFEVNDISAVNNGHAEINFNGATVTGGAGNVVITIDEQPHKEWTNPMLGQTYAVCNVANATTPKHISGLPSSALTKVGGIVSVLFTYGLAANDRISFGDPGDTEHIYPVYVNNRAIRADEAPNGTLATMIFDGSHYHVIALRGQSFADVSVMGDPAYRYTAVRQDGTLYYPISRIQKNGTTQTASNGSVNLSIPTMSYVALGDVAAMQVTDGNTTLNAPVLDSTTGIMSPAYLPTASSSVKGVVNVDTALSSSSANPVQNSAIYTALGEKITAPASAVSGNVLTYNGTNWVAVNIPVMGGSTATTGGAVGLVPFQPGSMHNGILNGDGKWRNLTISEMISRNSLDVPTEYDLALNAWDIDRMPQYSYIGFSTYDVGNSNMVATQTLNGFMSKTDKTKLDGIAAGAEANTIETVKVNGTALTPDAQGAVDVPVPITEIKLWTHVEAGESRGYYSLGGIMSGNPITLYFPGVDSSGLIKYQNLPSATSSQRGAVIVDTALSTSSTNPVQNSAIATGLNAKITAPSNPTTGAFLVWNGSAWVAQTLSTWQGGNY